jgi:NNP family nitrate/nitrite transporter-like MFS transporter
MRPIRPQPRPLAAYLEPLRQADAWWFMFFYGVTFGGFVGLAASLSIYFTDQFGLSPVVAGYCTAACVFAGSMVRPVGGALADRIGGTRTLSLVFALAAVTLATISTGPNLRRHGAGAVRHSPCWRSAPAMARSFSSCRSVSATRSV